MNDFERIQKLLKKLDVAFCIKEFITGRTGIKLVDVNYSFLFEAESGNIIKIIEQDKV